MSRSRLNRNIFLSLLLSLLFSTNIFAAINIPIIISEAIPDNVSGLDRVNEPVTVGIPLPESSGITSIDQLGISGSVIGQFRVLKRHPNNNIWWVLVDTQASVNANGASTLSLINGSGNFGGESLASDVGNQILINTGAATFTINKSNFNILDTVNVNGTGIVSNDNTGQIILEVGGTIYSSINSSPTVSIEENGPARCVVKTTGRLTSSAGSTLGGYILRIHFYKGKSYVRCDTEISNAYQDTTGTIYIDDATLRVPLSITGSLDYEFGYNNTSTSGTISGSAWIYQGNYGQYGDRAPDTGIEIGNNSSTVHSLGNSADYSQGWGIVDNGTAGLVAGIQQLKINEPAGMEFFENGIVDISLVSHHKSSAIALQGGQHILNIVHLNFFDSRLNATQAEHLSQFPLVARTTLYHYNAAGGIYGISMVSVEDERAFFTANNHTFPEENIQNTLRDHVNRNYSWASSGTPNSDWNLKYLMDFMRTGNGALYLSALQGGIHNGCVATDRSDNFNFFDSPIDYHQSSAEWGASYDEEHTYWEGLAYLYLISGNEFYKDSIIDFGEWLEEYIKQTQWRSYYVLGYPRNWSRSYRNIGILAWILENQHYVSMTNDMTSLLFKTPDNDSAHNSGVNFERGYINTANGVDSDFMSSKLFPQSFQIVSFCMGEDWSTYEKLQDIIVGLGFFVYGEFYGETNSSCGGFGYKYKYNLDAANDPGYRSKQSEIVLVQAFYNSGSNYFLDRASKIMFGDIDCLWGNTVASELGAHALITATGKQSAGAIGCGFIDASGDGRVDIKTSHITDNGMGNYTLTWIEPQDDITHYQIKVSSQPLVENVNFNQQTRAYTYSPSSYDNFWAGLNISNEPTPISIGKELTATINIQEVLSAYNNRYGLTISDPGYISYNDNTSYYFAVKYFSDATFSSLPRPVITTININ